MTNEKPKTSEDSSEALLKAITEMSKAFQTLPTQVAKAVEASLATKVQQQQPPKQEQKQKPKPLPPDELERMSRHEFSQHIINTALSNIDEKLEAFQNSLSRLTETTQREQIAHRFEAARQRFPDFDRWRDEMAELIERVGYLDPEELYTLARAKHPEKAKEIDAELNQNKEPEPKESGRKAFLGMLPTNTPTKAEGEQPKYSTSREAAEAAFDEILGDASVDLIGTST